MQLNSQIMHYLAKVTNSKITILQTYLWQSTLLLSVLTVSCTRTILSTIGIFDNHCTIKTISAPGKQILYLPMHHIGTPAYYRHVIKLVDSLHRAGFIVCYEMLGISPKTDWATRDVLVRKYRKLTGSLQIGGYITKDGLLMGKQYPFLRKLINQPRGAILGLDSTTDVHLDVTLEQLMQAWETKYGKVLLDLCDWQTGYAQPYPCVKKYKQRVINCFLTTYRDQFIASGIRSMPETKIALLYGANHFKGIAEHLQYSGNVSQTMFK